MTPRGFVAITDNADPMSVLLYDRATAREVCRTPVFEPGRQRDATSRWSPSATR